MPHVDWKEVSNRKIQDREESLSPFSHWRPLPQPGLQKKNAFEVVHSSLNSREWEIVQLAVTALADAVKSRRFKAVEVAEAYCHAATVAQHLTNCLTVVFFDEAIARAKELDAYMDENDATVGPLHGVPISVKDHIKVKGKDTSTGYIAWCYKTVADEDAVAVAILRKAGAILFVKTNNPQTLLVRTHFSHLLAETEEYLISSHLKPITTFMEGLLARTMPTIHLEGVAGAKAR